MPTAEKLRENSFFPQLQREAVSLNSLLPSMRQRWNSEDPRKVTRELFGSLRNALAQEERKAVEELVDTLELFVLHFCINRLYRDTNPRQVTLVDKEGNEFSVQHTGPSFFLGRRKSIYQLLKTNTRKYFGQTGENQRVIQSYWDLLHTPSRILDGYEHYEGPILFTKDNRPLTFPQIDVLRQVWNAKK